MTTTLGLGVLAAVTVAAMLLMWWGWRRREAVNALVAQPREDGR